MPGPSYSSDSDTSTPRQLALPECSLNKTRRRGAQRLRRRRAEPTLTVQDMPIDVVKILKAVARKRKLKYTDFCRAILTQHARGIARGLR